MDGRFEPRTPPVSVGETIDVQIEAVGSKGDGIAKKDGFVLFIPGVNEGETVTVKVTKVLRKVGFAEVVGEGSGSASEGESEQAKESAEEATEEQDAEPEEPEEEVQDTEDFGEELEDEK